VQGAPPAEESRVASHVITEVSAVMFQRTRLIATAIVIGAAVIAAAIRPHGGSSSGAAAGTYTGTTSQGLHISFAVTRSGVESVQFDWRATCADGQVHTNTIELGSGTLSAGRFAVGGTLDTGASAAVSGAVHGATASGQLSRSGPSAFGTDCLATGVTWHAQATG
jgi:hypothetical protein